MVISYYNLYISLANCLLASKSILPLFGDKVIVVLLNIAKYINYYINKFTVLEYQLNSYENQEHLSHVNLRFHYGHIAMG